MARLRQVILPSSHKVLALMVSFCVLTINAEFAKHQMAAAGLDEEIGWQNELEMYQYGTQMDEENDELPALVGSDEELADSNFPFIPGNDEEKDQEFNIKKFHSKFFWTRPKKPYYMVDVGLNSTNPVDKKTLNGQKIMAFGFVDNDKFNDIVVTNSEMNTI